MYSPRMSRPSAAPLRIPPDAGHPNGITRAVSILNGATPPPRSSRLPFPAYLVVVMSRSSLFESIRLIDSLTRSRAIPIRPG